MRRALGAALTLLVIACSGQGAPAVDLSKSQLVLEMRDYAIAANVPATTAGKVTIGVRNLSNQEHSLNVIKTDLAPDKLAYDNGIAKAKEDGSVGEIKSLLATRSGSVTIDLTPGHYVLICNIAGHYQLGMRAEIRVN